MKISRRQIKEIFLGHIWEFENAISAAESEEKLKQWRIVSLLTITLAYLIPQYLTLNLITIHLLFSVLFSRLFNTAIEITKLDSMTRSNTFLRPCTQPASPLLQR